MPGSGPHRSTESPRRRVFATAAAVALVCLAASATVPALAGPDQRGTTRPSQPPKADRDGDRVFDDLEARLDRLARDRRVRVIVRLRAPATRERVRRLERAVGDFRVKDRFRVVKAFAATVTKGQVRALARRRSVVHVEADSPVRALNNTAQASFGVTEARADAPSLDGDADGSPATYSKDDLVAAVIDTGVDPGHADLDEGKVIAFKDFVDSRTAAYDDNGHGTHVAGTIAGDGDGRADGLYKGAAPDAALVGVKVLDRNGSGTMSDVTAGIDWVVQNRATYGIEAINLSLGASGCADGTDSTSIAVNNAHDAGIVVAVAAGNEGPGTCTVGSPGAAAKALTVGAMADMDEGGFHQAYFSSRGKTADGRIKPDVSAPGVRVTSAEAGTSAGYVTFSGTSMATPFVAGVALLMRDASATLSSQQVKDKIMQTAVDWARGDDNKTAGSSGADIDYGAGRLDGYAAIKAAGAAIDSPPPMPSHELREGSLSGTGDQVDYPVELKETKFPIAATMIMSDVERGTSRNPDFDLYLLDPTGTIVDKSEFTTRQEEVFLKPTVTGAYTVRVKSFRGGGNFFVDISAPTQDVTPPAAPSGLTATPGDGEVALDWSDSADVDLDGYDVYRSTTQGGPYSKINTLRLTTSAYTDTGLTNDTTYYYVVRAVDTAGNESAPSDEASATPTQTYSDVVLGTSGLSSYWRLEEDSGTTANDLKGTNDGTYSGGVTLGAAGALGGDDNPAASFDGVDDLVDFDPAGFGTPASVSVEAWIKLDATGKIHTAVTNADNEWNDGFLLYVGDNNRPGFVVAQSSSTRAAVTGTTTMVAGAWYHVVGTFDEPSDTARIYVNGSLERSSTYAGTITYSAGRDLLLAKQHKTFKQSTRFLQGSLDEPAVYAEALSATTIAQHYEEGEPHYRDVVLGTSGLSSYWRLEEISGTTANDLKGTNDGTYAGGVTLGAAGALGGDDNPAARFDGVDDFVDFDPAGFGTPASVSVEAWIKLDATGKVQVALTNSSSEWNDGFLLYVGDNDRSAFAVAQSSSTRAIVTSTTTMAAGAWYHVVGTFDEPSDTARIYVNGSLERSSTYAGTITYSAGRDLLLAKQHKTFNQSSRFLHGSLDEPAVYAEALSAATIADHYEAARR